MKTTPTHRPAARFLIAILLFTWLPNILQAQFNLTIQSTNVSCFGAANGQARAVVSGGVSPYTFNWSNGAATSEITSLSPGTYTVTVTDANQGTKIAATTITQPWAVGATVTGQSQICGVAPDGWAAAVPFGGISPYSYLWSNGATVPQITNLSQGLYRVTITDVNGCTTSASFNVGYWNEGLWVMKSSTDAPCGLATGSAHISAMSGTAPYTYLWSNGDTTDTAENLFPGSYTVVVTDANGCATDPQSVLVANDTPLPQGVLINEVFCVGHTDVLSEDINPYFTDIFWDLLNPADQITEGQGSNSIHITWGSAGLRSVVLAYGVDSNYCSSITYQISVALCTDTMDVSINATNVACFGDASGQAEALVTGGVSPYTYAWSNGETTALISDLLPGTYTVTVTDADKSSGTAVATITQPGSQLGVVLAGQSQICEVSPDGHVFVTAFGGTSPYTYLWSNGETTSQIDNLEGGIYVVTVTDANGCEASGTYNVGFWNQGIFLLTDKKNAVCGLENGSATATPMSGKAPYQYLWSTGETTETIQDLGEGTYTVVITDVNGCQNAPRSIEITDLSPSPEEIILAQPLCIDIPISFEMTLPPEFTYFYWSSSNPNDQIVAGQGTISAEIKWFGLGPRTVEMLYGADSTFCSLISYGVTTYICSTGTDEAWIDNVLVSPNPFSEVLHVNLPGDVPAETQFMISDVSGKILSRGILSSGDNTLKTNTLSAGFYLLTLRNGHEEKVWKLVK